MSAARTGLRAALLAALLTGPAARAAEHKTFREALGAGDKRMWARDYAGARAAAGAALKLAANPAEQIEVGLLNGRIATRAGEYDEAVQAYAEIIGSQRASVGHVLRAGLGLADMWSARKEYGKARVEVDHALARPGLRPRDRFGALSKKAWCYEREKEWDAAREVYAGIREDKEVDAYWSMRAGLAFAKTFVNERKYGDSRAAYEKLFDTPGISSSARKNIHAGIAYAYGREQRWPDARREYEKALALPGLSETDRLNVYCGIAGTYGGEKNAKAMKETIEVLLPIPKGPVVWKIGKLLELGRLSLKLQQPGYAVYAYKNVLQQRGLNARYRTEAYLKLVEARLMQRDLAGLKDVVASASADAKLSAKERFQAHAVIAGLRAIDEGSAVSRREIEEAQRELAKHGLKAADRLAAFDYGAKCFMKLRNHKIAREFLALGDGLLADEPPKVYRCRYMENAPLGAAGWALSPLLNDKAYRESRFGDYNQQDAARLVTDATVERAFTRDKKKSYYFEHTGFYMVYDRAGWHIFVLSGEPNAERVLADGASSGSLEMYFSPGHKGETYYQWIIELPKGKLHLYDWSSPHLHFRRLEGLFRTETIAFGKNWGTYIFIPWEALYDKLPLDSERWPFGVIRWTPAGGITWGGKVHEIGKWGLVDWQKPAPQQGLAIKRNVLRKAWGKYQRSRQTQETFWTDDERGDPEFWNRALKPVLERLDGHGETLKAPEELADQDVELLFKNAIGDWMEFDYLVSELRSAWIERKLFSSGTEGD